MGVRPQLLETLADLGRTRVSIRALEERILIEMEQGYKPMFRGHEWGREHFEAIESAERALEAAWELLKWVQFPEMRSRLEAAHELTIPGRWEEPRQPTETRTPLHLQSRVP